MKAVIVVMMIFLIASFYARVQADGPVYEVTLDPPACYVPTKVIFNFPTTSNASLEDISTVSQSATGYSGEYSPTMYTFIAKEVDIYTFTLHIHFENTTAANESRTVLISMWSGSLAPGGYSVISSETDFIIHVRLSLTQQPTMPSSEEIAEAEFRLVEERFVGMFDQLTVQNQQIADLSSKITILSFVATTFAIVALAASLAAFKKRGS